MLNYTFVTYFFISVVCGEKIGAFLVWPSVKIMLNSDIDPSYKESYN